MFLISKFREHCNLYAKYTLLLATLSVPLSTSLMNFFFPLTIFLVLIGSAWKTKWQIIRMSPVLPAVMLLFGIYVLGVFYAVTPWSAAFKELVKYDKLLLFPFLLPLLVEDRWRLRVLAVFLIAVLISLVAGYLQYFQIVNFHFLHLKNFGAASVFKNRSTTNLLMAISVYIAILSVLHFKKFRWYLLTYAFFGTIFVCFLSDGRVGYLVLFGLLLLLGWQWKSWSGLVLSLLTLTLILILAYALPTPLSNRIHGTAAVFSHTNQTEFSTVERADAAKNTVAMIKAHPILGSGTGSYASTYPQFSHEDSDSAQNQYLQTTAELGLLGLFIFLLFLIQQARYAQRLPKYWYHLASALVLSQTLASISLVILSDTTESHFFVLMLAVCFAHLSNPQHRKN